MAPPRHPHPAPRVLGIVFAVILLSWITLPLALQGTGDRGTADATAYVTAVRQVADAPRYLYVEPIESWDDVTPEYRRTWCLTVATPAPTRCHGLAYLASPLALPLIWSVSCAGNTLGTGVFRVLSALGLIAAMWLLWRRIAGRSRDAAASLVIAAVLLTPLALKTVSIGQVSPLLFVSVALGMELRRPARRAGAVAAWVGAVAFKTSPVVIAAVLVWRRRLRALVGAAVALALLFALSLAFVPLGVWTRYLAMNRELARFAGAIPHNSSLASFVGLVTGRGFAEAHALGIQLGVIVVAVVFCAATMRHADDDVAWALGHLGWLLAIPLVWSHYLWVVFGASVVVVAARRTSIDRLVWLLPVIALLISAPVTFGAENTFLRFALPLPASARFWAWYRPLAMLAAIGSVGLVATVSGRPARVPDGQSTDNA